MKLKILLIAGLILISYTYIYSQDPLISISPEEGFIFELTPNNPQTTVMFTIYNEGQFPVVLDLKVESSDSTYILYLEEPDTNTFNGNIWRMRPDGSEKTQLTYDTLDRDATWSPDGNKIAFFSYRSGNADIWVMDSDGTNLINLTNHPAGDFSPHWSPDGQYIIFSSNIDDPNFEIYRMTPTGTNIVRLTFNSHADVRPRYSPDGQHFATSSRIPGGDLDIYVYTSDGSSFANIGGPDKYDWQPSWTPDSKRVVWCSGPNYINSEIEIVSANKDGSNYRLEYSTPENEYYPRYSPDGQFLAFPKSTFYPTSGDEIFVWHKTLDTLTQITGNTPITREWGPEWSPFLGSPNWLLVSQNSVQIVEGDSISIDIDIDASGLTFGRHTASVMIYNAENNVLLAVVPINLFYVQVSDVKVGSELPRTFSLSQNYPNPFNPNTSIQYAISSMQFVTLKIYDILGNEIATLVNEQKLVGNYEVEFDATLLSSGIYFYRLRTNDFTQIKKMILLR